VLDEFGQPTSPQLTLQEITLVRPQEPSQPPLPNRVDLPYGELTLLSADFDRDQAAPGDPVRFNTIWRAEVPTGEVPFYPGSVTITLIDPSGQTRATYLAPTAPSWYTTEKWIPGDVWLGQSELTLPADLETGTYAWSAELDSSAENVLQQLGIAAPDHSFIAPTPQYQVNITLGNLATLVGYDMEAESVRPGEELRVTLVWRAEGTGSESYHVFLHLLDQTGVLVTQSDGIPAMWTRPTTGWLAGEYIIDTRTLSLPSDTPPGEYKLSSGLYVPDGDRLHTPDGSDAIELLYVEVEEE
jgi:hypothetical protein